jgi:hypothetical protein
MGKSQRTKGQIGEREWAKILNDKFGTNYQRTPLSGGLDLKGDVRKAYGSKPSRIDDFSWEVKRQEKLNIYKALDQASRDSRYLTPIVAHRRNNGGWMCTLYAEDLLNIIKELEDLSSV